MRRVPSRMHRRLTAVPVAVAALALAAACGAPSGNSGGGSTGGTVPDTPSKAITLNVLDVGGQKAESGAMIDEFIKNNPKVISKVTWTKATAPELSGKIKAQQNAGRVQLQLVLTGLDGVSAGNEQGLWVDYTPFKSRLSNMNNYSDAGKRAQVLGGSTCITTITTPSGPILEYMPNLVSDPPKTPAALLAWAKAHPGKFQYARPANSGPGRTFLMGLPYLLGDKDPMDPVNGWTKTWAYLAQLGKYVSNYPSTTSETMTNIGNGTSPIIASTLGWDINPRVIGTVPKSADVIKMDGTTFVQDEQYACIPKGVDTDTQAALLLLIQNMLTPGQQAKAYDDGFFYPGPAIDGVTLSQAPASSQTTIKNFGRPEYDQWIKSTKIVAPLNNANLVKAFDIWDRTIGGSKVKK